MKCDDGCLTTKLDFTTSYYSCCVILLCDTINMHSMVIIIIIFVGTSFHSLWAIVT